MALSCRLFQPFFKLKLFYLILWWILVVDQFSFKIRRKRLKNKTFKAKAHKQTIFSSNIYSVSYNTSWKIRRVNAFIHKNHVWSNGYKRQDFRKCMTVSKDLSTRYRLSPKKKMPLFVLFRVSDDSSKPHTFCMHFNSVQDQHWFIDPTDQPISFFLHILLLYTHIYIHTHSNCLY